ncbi:MAG: hydrolase TatD [Candidatus Zambryskibacteria bacterium CG10_big_fil_rev_8_21_14_0_10_42_12]|uniref:Hydrolase TatD n=1 Tax=Candidatus Zambryskibacteria bacterium CG10_big_fil_rev_8_21_14_0_10_42_12 TaxID=1975115 RepID=A0A2H0QXS8_9BACT|nr:MAG: hydrolase TatD [Candidatus Zambryskibacteria bacterium CG10_big_fil_rev_8_21_14_0_10_42_12]
MNNYRAIDIHCHTNFAAFDEDRDEVISRTLDAGVYMINVGTQKDTSKSGVELAQKYEKGVYATVGLHPIHTDKSFHDEAEIGEGGSNFNSRDEVFDAEYYRELAQDPKVVAIGECGLDYFRTDKESEQKQRDAFIAQVHVANEVRKPMMLHVRNGQDGRSAYADVLDIIKSEATVLGNVHFFAGSKEDAKKFLDLGFTLSFTGVITFAKEYKELVEFVPDDMIHAETDAPYVAPVPERGKRNEPLFVTHVVEKMASIKGKAVEDMQAILRANTERLFKIV